jgi:hypothetical protein
MVLGISCELSIKDYWVQIGIAMKAIKQNPIKKAAYPVGYGGATGRIPK